MCPKGTLAVIPRLRSAAIMLRWERVADRTRTLTVSEEVCATDILEKTIKEPPFFKASLLMKCHNQIHLNYKLTA